MPEVKQGKGKVFENPVLDIFTKATPLTSIITYWGLIAFYIWQGVKRGAVSNPWAAVALVVSGLLAWSLVEYIWHRWMGHITSWAGKSKFLQRFEYILHGTHHEYPRDAQRLLMPPLPGIALSAFFFGVFALIFLPFNWELNWFFMVGITFGYFMYSFLHYAIHKFQPPKRLRFLWKHHSLHHYQYPDRAFGVSSTFWDHIFRTLPPRKATK